MEIFVDMRGVEAMVKKFESMGKRGDAAMMKAITEASVEAVSKMKTNVPVVTNRLRSSIHFETPKTASFQYTDKNGQSYIGDFIRKPIGLSVAVGTNVNYAEDVNKNSSKGRGFFKKGFDKAREELPKRMQKNLDKLFNEKR